MKDNDSNEKHYHKDSEEESHSTSLLRRMKKMTQSVQMNIR